MGWKASAILIKPAGEVDDRQLLDLFGYGEAVATEEPDYLEAAIYPSDNRLYLARYQDCLIICVNDFPLRFFENDLSYIEQQLMARFPKSEILAISLHSGTNHYGYALLQNGKKIRMKTGYSDAPVLIETGEPLPEELELYKQAKPNEKGQKLFYFERWPDHPFPEDAVGENFVFSVTSRFLGEPLDQNDEFLEIRAKEYILKEADADRDESIPLPKERISVLPAWFQKYKFGILLVILLLVYLVQYFARR